MVNKHGYGSVLASAPGAQGVERMVRAGLTGEKKRAPGIHCMRMREQRWNSTAAVLFLVMIVHVINIHIVDSSQ